VIRDFRGSLSVAGMLMRASETAGDARCMLLHAIGLSKGSKKACCRLPGATRQEAGSVRLFSV
jgi:hypothetical protein